MKIKDKETGKVSEIKLPKAFKTKWVKALRSGKYLQTKGNLFDADANDGQGGYCCLGVACEITKVDYNLQGKSYIESNVSSAAKGLVPQILHGDDDNTLVHKLATMNDGEGTKPKSFKQIAAYIERYL